MKRMKGLFANSFLMHVFCVSKGKNLAPDWEKESEDLGFKFGVGPGVYQVRHVLISHIILIIYMPFHLMKDMMLDF